MSRIRCAIGVDFSAASLAALHWSVRHIAPVAETLAVHVVDLPEPPRFLAPLLPSVAPAREAAAEGAGARLVALSSSPLSGLHGVVRVGRAATELLQVASDHHVRELVVGPHGVRAGLGRLIGSTAMRVAREGTATVIVAQGELDRPAARVLVALEDSDAARRALEWATAFAIRNDCELVALHTIDPALSGAVSMGAAPRERRGAIQQLAVAAQAWLDKTAAVIVPADVRLTTLVRSGDPCAEILAAIVAVDADLVVVGRGRPGVTGRIGSVADGILRSAAISTAVTA